MSQVFCPAERGDGKRILEILECAPAKGSIELLYTRRPDACLSYQKESKDARIYVAKDGERIIGTVAEIPRQVYLGGEVKNAAYLCGLKKDIHYPGAVNWGKAFFRDLVSEDIDAYFCSVVGDNTAIRNMFEKKKRRIARTEHLQRYTTYMIAPYFQLKEKACDCIFKQAERAEEQQILDFLNSEGRKKELFPVIRRLDQFSDLSVDNFYLLKNESGILAVGALWNQSGYRQYLVKKYRGMMKLARCLNPLLHMLGYIRLPKENESLRFPMLSFFLSRDDNEDYYKAFLNHIAREIRKSYDMFVIGTTESYFADPIYRSLKNIHFETEIYAIDFLYGNGKQHPIHKESLWLECGLL